MTILDVLGIEYSIKATGIEQGVGAVHLRLAGCNLLCKNCIRPRQSGSKTEIHEIADNINILGKNRLVVTGGEPLKQRLKLMELLKLLPDYHTVIETNGTYSPNFIEDYVDKWDICLKLSNSRQRKTRRERPMNIRKFIGMDNAYFYFEINSNRDLYDYTYLQKKYGFDRERVILGCKNENLEDLVLGQCKNRGLVFQVPLSPVLR